MAYGSSGFRGGGSSRGGSGFRSGGFRRSFGPREMTKIKCSECGKEDEVPFKPRNDSPVYCKDCYFKKKGITPRTGNAEGFSEKSAEKPAKAKKVAEDSDEFAEEETESEEAEELKEAA